MGKQEELLEEISSTLHDIQSNTVRNHDIIETLSGIHGAVSYLTDSLGGSCWEYAVDTKETYPSDLDMGYRGRERWELVSVDWVKGVQFGMKGHYHAIYKRRCGCID
tara:strand:- start:458 stop:778 length:321 start_codon:yes stop_codon:yes gene_type:complete